MRNVLLMAALAALSLATAHAQSTGTARPTAPTTGTSQVGPGAATSPSTGTGAGEQAQIPSGRSDDDINSKSRNGAGPLSTTPSH
jgi:hypothetical protein